MSPKLGKLTNTVQDLEMKWKKKEKCKSQTKMYSNQRNVSVALNSALNPEDET